VLIALDIVTLLFLAACWPGIKDDRNGRRGLLGFGAVLVCNLLGWLLL
jgi:hypothetical protein